MRWKWPDREWLLVTNKGEKGEKLPKVLDKTEAEALELFIEVPGHGDHDKLGNSQQKDEMNDKPGDDPIGESIEHPHERKRHPGGTQNAFAVSRLIVGHQALPRRQACRTPHVWPKMGSSTRSGSFSQARNRRAAMSNGPAS